MRKKLHDGPSGDITQHLIPADSFSEYSVTAPNATISYKIRASTGGGEIYHNSVLIDRAGAGLNNAEVKTGSFEAVKGDAIKYYSQYGEYVYITEHFG